MTEWKIPFGHAKGETLRDTDPANITTMIAKMEAKLREKPLGRTAAWEREWLRAARAELGIRRVKRFASGLKSAKAVRDAFEELAPVVNLISPSLDCVRLPDGCDVSVTFVQLNGNLLPGQSMNNDVYRAKDGNLSLTKEALNQIARAAGVDWLPNLCARVDDRSHPHYVEYKAVGKWRRLDNSEHIEDRCRAADLRDKSDEVTEMTPNQLAMARKFILPLGESKAKNRVIRELGIKSSYTEEELEKPFAVARLVHTGRTKDPVLRREFALQTQRNMESSTTAMFGPPARPLALRAPPPVGLTGAELDDHYWENRDIAPIDEAG